MRKLRNNTTRAAGTCAAAAAVLAFAGGCSALDARFRAGANTDATASCDGLAASLNDADPSAAIPAGFTRLRILVPVLSGRPAAVTGWQAAFDAWQTGREVRVKGLGEWRDPGYWSIQDGAVRFRARRPGPQDPRFALALGDQTKKFLFHCNVRLSRLPVDFQWQALERVRNTMRVPFEATVPKGFTPPFAVSVAPLKALVVTQPSRRTPLSRQVRGYLVCEELRPTDRFLLFRLKDATGAEAETRMDIPDECECIAPPARIRAIAGRFRSGADILAEAARILEAPDKTAILTSALGKDFAILSEWIGALEKCPTLSDRLRRLFKDQAVLYRRILAGEPEPTGEAARLLTALRQLSSGDIEDEFLEGYYGK